MSQTTTTPNYGLVKPNVNADNDLWGDHLNADLDQLDSLIHSIDVRPAGGVTSWNTRTGAVTLQPGDVTTALGFTPYNATNPAGYQTAAQVSQALPVGSSTLPLVDMSTAQVGVGTTWARADHQHPTDVTRAPLASPIFTGAPSLPTGTIAVTQTAGNNSTAPATTAFVAAAIGALPSYAPLASPVFTGDPRAPTATAGDNDTSIATTAFVQNAVTGYAPIASPTFTGDPRAPTPLAGDADTSIATTSFVATATANAVAPTANNVGRNLLHNPLFAVAQRGRGPWTTQGYNTDRWSTSFSGGTAGINVYAMADATRTAIGDEAAQWQLTHVMTGTGGAADYYEMIQKIEGVMRLSGKTVTVSFWAVATSGTPKVGVSIDQQFGTGGSPSATAIGNGQAVTISTTWTRYSLQFAVPSVIGKTLGSNGDDSTQLNIWMSSGANNATRAGNIGVQSATFTFWGIQLEIGSSTTPLEKPDPQQDLAKCQRFFEVGAFVALHYNTAGGANITWLGYNNTKRAIPTVTFSNVVYSNASGITANQPAGSYGGFGVQIAVTANGGASAYGLWQASADL